jgi:hypothetical protein
LGTGIGFFPILDILDSPAPPRLVAVGFRPNYVRLVCYRIRAKH